MNLQLRLNEGKESSEELIKYAEQLQLKIWSRYDLDQTYNKTNFDKNIRNAPEKNTNVHDSKYKIHLEGEYLTAALTEAKPSLDFSLQKIDRSCIF